MTSIPTGGPFPGQMLALLNPGAVFIVVGLFILFFGGCRLGDPNPRLPGSAADWVPYICASAIIILIGFWIFNVAGGR